MHRYTYSMTTQAEAPKGTPCEATRHAARGKRTDGQRRAGFLTRQRRADEAHDALRYKIIWQPAS